MENRNLTYKKDSSVRKPEKSFMEILTSNYRFLTLNTILFAINMSMAACRGEDLPVQNIHKATMEAINNARTANEVNNEYQENDNIESEQNNSAFQATKTAETVTAEAIAAQDAITLEDLRREIQQYTENTPEPPTSPYQWGEIEFNTEKPVQMAVNLPNTNIKINIKPVVYRKDFTPEEGKIFMNETYAPGEGTAYSVTDKYDNLIISGHSGYIPTLLRYKDLEFEGLRQWFEGSSRSNPRAFLPNSERESRISSAVGSTVEMTHPETSEEEVFSVEAVAYVPHERLQEFIMDTQSYTDVLVDITGGSESPFYRFTQDERAIYIVFCGWGYDKNDEFDQEYSRYVVALTPVD